MYVMEQEEVKSLRKNGCFFVAIIGEPKTGKSRLIGSAVEMPQYDKMLYIAADPNSESLSSILPQHRSKVTVVMPGIQMVKDSELPSEEIRGPEYKFHAGLQRWVKMTDYVEDLVRIATHDWAALGYKIIAADTGSAIGEQILKETSLKGHRANYGQKRHVFNMSASTTAADIPAQYMVAAAPNQPDYGLAQKFFIHNFLQPLMNQTLPVVISFHTLVDRELGMAGPLAVSSGMLPKVPGWFDLVVVSEVGKTGRHQLQVKPYKFNNLFHMPAGIRDGNETEVFKDQIFSLDKNPANFWRQMLKLSDEQMGE